MSPSDELPVLPMGYKWHVARTLTNPPLELQIWRSECQPTSEGDEWRHVAPWMLTTMPQEHKPVASEPIWNPRKPKLAKAAKRAMLKLRRIREENVAIDVLMERINNKEDKK